MTTQIETRSCTSEESRNPLQLLPRLTRREAQVLECLAHSYSNKRIALALGTTEATIKNQVMSLFNKTGAGSRMELFLIALQEGLIELPADILDTTARRSVMAIVHVFEGEAARWRRLLERRSVRPDQAKQLASGKK